MCRVLGGVSGVQSISDSEEGSDCRQETAAHQLQSNSDSGGTPFPEVKWHCTIRSKTADHSDLCAAKFPGVAQVCHL